MTELVICSLEATNGGVSVAGQLERSDGALIVVVDGNRVARVQRVKEGVHELAQQVRRKLPGRAADGWGVVANCLTGGFAFGYGSLAGGGSGAPQRFAPCVQNKIRTYPEAARTLGSALAHAESALADCCA